MTAHRPPIRLGIIGAGVMGARREAAALADPRFAHVATVDGQAAADDMLRSDALDAVVIAVTPDAAPGLTATALERGLHVLCEKPPARSLAELGPVIDAARRHPDTQLAFGFNHRHHGSVVAARALVASGRYGTVVGMRGVYGKRADGMSGWRTEPATSGGGILRDQGVHMVDLMHVFAGGPFTDVTGRISHTHQADVEDSAWALLTTDTGVVATLCSSAVEAREIFRLELMLSDGRLTLAGILSGSGAYAPERLIAERPGAEPAVTSYAVDHSWAHELSAFGDAIERGTAVADGTLSQAAAATRVVDGIYASASRRDSARREGTRA